MNPALYNFLSRHQAIAEECLTWGAMPLHLTCYLTTELPPLDYISSVRAVVFHEQSVLVIHDGEGPFVLPGGRCERGETVEETLKRELLEETGYTVRDCAMMGVMHFHHLAPAPDGYPYPYPDFLQLVFTAHANEHRPEQMVADPFVKHTAMMPAIEALQLPLRAADRAFLSAALGLRSHRAFSAHDR